MSEPRTREKQTSRRALPGTNLAFGKSTNEFCALWFYLIAPGQHVPTHNATAQQGGARLHSWHPTTTTHWAVPTNSFALSESYACARDP
jgi:hypothetical protein